MFASPTGWDHRVCKFNRLHVHILRFSFINVKYILKIPRKRSVNLLQSWTSTGYFSNSTGSSVCRFSPIDAGGGAGLRAEGGARPLGFSAGCRCQKAHPRRPTAGGHLAAEANRTFGPCAQVFRRTLQARSWGGGPLRHGEGRMRLIPPRHSAWLKVLMCPPPMTFPGCGLELHEDNESMVPGTKMYWQIDSSILILACEGWSSLWS